MLIVLQPCTPSCLASFLCLTLKTLLALTAGEQPVEWQKLRSVLRPAGRQSPPPLGLSQPLPSPPVLQQGLMRAFNFSFTTS